MRQIFDKTLALILAMTMLLNTATMALAESPAYYNSGDSAAAEIVKKDDDSAVEATGDIDSQKVIAFIELCEALPEIDSINEKNAESYTSDYCRVALAFEALSEAEQQLVKRDSKFEALDALKEALNENGVDAEKALTQAREAASHPVMMMAMLGSSPANPAPAITIEASADGFVYDLQKPFRSHITTDYAGGDTLYYIIADAAPESAPELNSDLPDGAVALPADGTIAITPEKTLLIYAAAEADGAKTVTAFGSHAMAVDEIYHFTGGLTFDRTAKTITVPAGAFCKVTGSSQFGIFAATDATGSQFNQVTLLDEQGGVDLSEYTLVACGGSTIQCNNPAIFIRAVTEKAGESATLVTVNSRPAGVGEFTNELISYSSGDITVKGNVDISGWSTEMLNQVYYYAIGYSSSIVYRQIVLGYGQTLTLLNNAHLTLRSLMEMGTIAYGSGATLTVTNEHETMPNTAVRFLNADEVEIDAAHPLHSGEDFIVEFTLTEKQRRMLLAGNANVAYSGPQAHNNSGQALSSADGAVMVSISGSELCAATGSLKTDIDCYYYFGYPATIENGVARAYIKGLSDYTFSWGATITGMRLKPGTPSFTIKMTSYAEGQANYEQTITGPTVLGQIPAALSIVNTDGSDITAAQKVLGIGTSLTVKTSGGSGSGAVSFEVSGVNADKVALTDNGDGTATIFALSPVANGVQIIATKAADDDYAEGTATLSSIKVSAIDFANGGYALSPASPNGDNGWYKSDITVSRNTDMTDKGWGVAAAVSDSGAQSFVISSESAAGSQSVYAVKTVSGQKCTIPLANVTYKLDKTAPLITASAQSALGDVRAQYSLTVTEALSGVGSFSAVEANSKAFALSQDADANTVTFIGLSPNTAYSFNVTAMDNAGNASAVYAISFTTQKKNLTISDTRTAADTDVYGTALSALTQLDKIKFYDGSTLIAGSFTYPDGAANIYPKVGAATGYTVRFVPTATQYEPYSFTVVPQMTKKTLTIDGSCDDHIYDGTVTVDGLNLFTADILSGDEVNILKFANGSYRGEFASANAGNDIPIINVAYNGLGGADAGNYAPVMGTVKGNIAKRDITVAPNAGQSKAYGDADLALTYTVGNLVAGESLSGALARDTGENVNTYSITQGTLTDANNPNYHITFDDTKKFAITKRQLSWNTSGLSAAKKATDSGEAVVYGDLSVNGILNNEVTFAASDLITSGFSGTKAAGSYTVNVSYNGVFTPAAPSNYALPVGAPVMTAAVNSVSTGEVVAPAGQTPSYAGIEGGISTVPESLKNDPELNTPAKIIAKVTEELENEAGVTSANIQVYDVTLMIQQGGGWVEVTPESFPPEGVTVILPYPAGVGEDYSRYDFTVSHMMTYGARAGEIETLSSEKTPSGLKVTFMSLSPVGIGWQTAAASGSSAHRRGENGYSANESAFWSNVESAVKRAASGDIVSVSAKSFDRMPSEVMSALSDKNGVSLVISWNGGDGITVSSERALTPESNRIYYPLSYLAEKYAGAYSPVAVSTAANAQNAAAPAASTADGNPATGSVIEISAPVLSDTDDTAAVPTAPDMGMMQEATAALEPTREAPKASAVIPTCAALMLAALCGGGLWFYKQRKSEW